MCQRLLQGHIAEAAPQWDRSHRESQAEISYCAVCTAVFLFRFCPSFENASSVMVAQKTQIETRQFRGLFERVFTRCIVLRCVVPRCVVQVKTVKSRCKCARKSTGGILLIIFETSYKLTLISGCATQSRIASRPLGSSI